MIFLTTLILIIIFSLSIINYNRLVSNNSNNVKFINNILVLLLIIASVVYTILTLNLVFNGYIPEFIPTTSINCNIPDGNSSSLLQDHHHHPVRWWPSGVPQSAIVVGTMLGVFCALGKVGSSSLSNKNTHSLSEFSIY